MNSIHMALFLSLFSISEFPPSALFFKKNFLKSDLKAKLNLKKDTNFGEAISSNTASAHRNR